MGEQMSRYYDARNRVEQINAETIHGQLESVYREMQSMGEVIKITSVRIYVFSRTQAELEKRLGEIIDELEGHKRGVYGGAIGYIDFTGNMDCCIGIRLAYKKKNHVFVCSGAGIVADSVPEQEHQECINKAKAVVLALEKADGGID